MSPTAYPLAWPSHFTRTLAAKREKGQFRTSLPAAIKNVQGSLRLFAADSRKPLTNVVISSNVTLSVDNPADPGVAVYFTWDDMDTCIPVDRYTTLAANLQAIHHIIEARRAELRHGTLQLVRASMKGFLALPAPDGQRPWREVLGLAHVPTANIAKATIENAYRSLAMVMHPDKRGGSEEKMAELNAARDRALKELGEG